MSKSKQPEHKINKTDLTSLVKKAQKGNRAAMDKIVQNTVDYIYYYCLSLLCDEEKARDCVQEIFLILLQKLSSLKNPEAFLGWIKIITANCCKNKINRAVPELPSESELEQDLDVSINPEKCIETEEICHAVLIAVRSLPEIFREVILLRYYQDLKISQISALLGVSEGTIKSRLYRARKMIKDKLVEMGMNNPSLDGFSPLAYLEYCLIEDSYHKKLSEEIIIPTKKFDVPAVPIPESSQAYSALASSLSFSGKASAAVKIAAVITASAVAAGGIAVHTIRQTLGQSQVSVASESEINKSVSSEVNVNKRLEAIGYTKNDLRKTLSFDERKDNLNSEDNKSYIFDRMCNTIDYYDTVQAEFTLEYKEYKRVISYFIDKQNNREKALIYDYSDYNYPDSALIKPYEYYCAEDSIEIDWLFNEAEQKDYSFDLNPPFESMEGSPFSEIYSLAQKPLASEMKKKDVWGRYLNSRLSDKDSGYIKYVDSKMRIISEGDTLSLMPRIPISYALNAEWQYNPHWIVSRFLLDFDSWSITKNNTAQNTLTLSGEYHGEKFDMIVHKQTGMVLDFESDILNKDEMPLLETTYYSINKPIDNAVFDNLKKL